MSSTSINRHGGGYTPDFNDLGGVVVTPTRPVMRTHLLPGELEASLPSPQDVPQEPIAPLTQFLGAQLTAANPAWTGDPVPRMRSLQKALVGHSLTLPEDDRAALMKAITVVETAVQLRLRLQQMRMKDAELNIKPQGAKKP